MKASSAQFVALMKDMKTIQNRRRDDKKVQCVNVTCDSAAKPFFFKKNNKLLFYLGLGVTLFLTNATSKGTYECHIPRDSNF